MRDNSLDSTFQLFGTLYLNWARNHQESYGWYISLGAISDFFVWGMTRLGAFWNFKESLVASDVMQYCKVDYLGALGGVIERILGHTINFFFHPQNVFDRKYGMRQPGLSCYTPFYQ